MRGSMAIRAGGAMRWRWPPDNCAWMAFAERYELHQIEQSLKRARGCRPPAAKPSASAALKRRHFLEHRHCRNARTA